MKKIIFTLLISILFIPNVFAYTNIYVTHNASTFASISYSYKDKTPSSWCFVSTCLYKYVFDSVADYGSAQWTNFARFVFTLDSNVDYSKYDSFIISYFGSPSSNVKTSNGICTPLNVSVDDNVNSNENVVVDGVYQCPIGEINNNQMYIDFTPNTSLSLSYQFINQITLIDSKDSSNDIVGAIHEQTKQQQETNKQLGDLNNNITSTDTSGASGSANEFFSGFESDDFGLSSIITAPLNLIKSITSSTCTPIGFTAPFVNQQVTLPCMSSIYKEHFGSFLTIYQTITFGMIAYWVSVKIFFMVKGFKDPDSDRIEVLDL